MKLKKSLIPILALIFQLTQSFAQDKNYEEWYLTTKDSVAIFVKEIKSQSKDTVIVIHGGFGANQDYMLVAIKGLGKNSTLFFMTKEAHYYHLLHLKS
jgi:proline iminopeptidase